MYDAEWNERTSPHGGSTEGVEEEEDGRGTKGREKEEGRKERKGGKKKKEQEEARRKSSHSMVVYSTVGQAVDMIHSTACRWRARFVPRPN